MNDEDFNHVAAYIQATHAYIEALKARVRAAHACSVAAIVIGLAWALLAYEYGVMIGEANAAGLTQETTP